MRENVSYSVEISFGSQTKLYSPSFQSEHQFADAWKRVLVMAHGKAVVTCQCSGLGEKRLSVVNLFDRYHLARFPDTGNQHADDCRFFSVDPADSGMAGYKRGVIQELDDGNIKIKLKVGLQRQSTKAPSVDSEPSSAVKAATRTTTSQSSMSPLGLLHYLWTLTGLNTWSPGMLGKRNLGVVHHHLMEAAKTLFVGRIQLSRNLLIGTPSESSVQAKTNQAKAVSAHVTRQRLLVIAPLTRSAEDANRHRSLPISGFHGIPHLNVADGLWDVTEKRFPAMMAAWATGARIVAIAQTDPPRACGDMLNAPVVDMALMWLSDHWIPVDSGFERIVAEELVARNRRFEKPLRFDGSDCGLPDFRLKDSYQALPMEVWGMATPEYEARKTEKTAQYDAAYGPNGWWSWDAISGDPMPPFPERSLNAREYPNSMAAGSADSISSVPSSDSNPTQSGESVSLGGDQTTPSHQ